MRKLTGWSLGVALLLTAGALYLLWLVRVVALVLFGGILLALFLHRTARLVRRLLPISDTLAVLLVLALLLAVLAGSGSLFAATIILQFEELAHIVPEALIRASAALERFPALQRQLEFFLPSSGSYIAPAHQVAAGLRGAVSTTSWVVGIGFLAVILALYTALNPGLYVRGLLHLVPPPLRGRALLAVQRSTSVLWWWMLGRAATMLIIGTLTTVSLWLLHIPLAGSLGLLAGLFSFVPYIGPILASVPAVLVGFTQGPGVVILVLAVYIGVQFIEGNILTPVLERRMIRLPPSLAVSMQLIAGVLAGPVGVMLASPLTALAIVLTQTFYVEGMLGDETAQGLAPQ
ncbi:MAG: hypothetical protein COT71_00480 [Candidatus Andersenbacteria bacterium CG10_big_fil_rev_8_21_14_0_10_54_11]|uniref:AI-2E family transporter n=1 Tax=Candidatus Andersenbacteria bacterium CG10_big_fil_rev_8_21_14_0_10_54_11 TaxID=1974485 RepID=A0A2M6X074_9BACT|nr:MAG: hypothetical protein COT71_00480 [Candidatus Andersenbacteria bacterium CG10_big_fil_rev_8_21_14_0_10_54_11]